MSHTDLSRRMEHYLEAVLEASAGRGYARCSELAKRLGVSRSTVTEMLQKLSARGLVVHAPCEPVLLTPDGERTAALIRDRHRALRALLLHVGLTEETARREACVLEHALRGETIERIRDFVEQRIAGGSAEVPEPNGLRPVRGPSNGLREALIRT